MIPWFPSYSKPSIKAWKLLGDEYKINGICLEWWGGKRGEGGGAGGEGRRRGLEGQEIDQELAFACGSKQIF